MKKKLKNLNQILAQLNERPGTGRDDCGCNPAGKIEEEEVTNFTLTCLSGGGTPSFDKISYCTPQCNGACTLIGKCSNSVPKTTQWFNQNCGSRDQRMN